MSDVSTPQAKMTPEQRKLLAVTLVPLFMSLLSVSIVNVVLPSMQSALSAPDSAVQWVLSGYTLAFGVMLVGGGRAGDLFGRGRLFAIGLAIFGLGSLGAGLATGAVMLNIARIVMGIGSGLLSPQGVGMIQQFFAGAQRAKAFGTFGTVVGVSVAVGPVLGGVFVTFIGGEWGWRWAFLVNVPIALIAMIVGRYWLPAAAWHGVDAGASITDDKPRGRADFDPVGIVLLALGTLLVMLPFLERAAGTWIFLLLIVGVALVVVWVLWERRYAARGREPMVHMDLFKTRTFANGALISAVYFTAVPGIWVIIALYLQDGKGYSALAAGAIGLPSAAFSAIVPQITARVVLRLGRKLVVFGIAVALIAILACIGVVVANELWGVSELWLLASLALVGIAQGMVISPNQTLTLADVPVRFAGVAGGVLQTGQRVGTAIGIAIITAVFFLAQNSGGYGAGFAWAFGAIAAIIVLAGIVGLIDLATGRKRR